MDDHVRTTIPIHILKSECHWGQILAVSEQRWTIVDDRLGNISTGDLNNEYMPMEVYGDEVARMLEGVIMSYYRINLKSAWSAKGTIILMDLPPGAKCTETNIAEHHRQKGDTNIKEPMKPVRSS